MGTKEICFYSNYDKIMKLYYTFVKNCREYDFEFEVEDSDVIDLIRFDLENDGIDPFDDENETIVDDYIENAIDFIKEHFENDAFEAFEDELEYSKSPMGYYGISDRDFV